MLNSAVIAAVAEIVNLKDAAPAVNLHSSCCSNYFCLGFCGCRYPTVTQLLLILLLLMQALQMFVIDVVYCI